MRSLVSSLLGVIAFFASFYVTPSDFAQDYLAARAVIEGLDPNTASKVLADRYGVPSDVITSVQTAHPPLVTAVAYPFALLPWRRARVFWELSLCSATTILIIAAGIAWVDVAVLAPAWIFGMALGNIDAIVVCLCLASLRTFGKGWLGLATALKVYPALLILGLIVTRRYKEAAIEIGVGAGLTILATSLLGFDSLVGWLRYIPHNGDSFAVGMLNLSLTKFMALAGGKTFFVTLLGLGAVARQFGRRDLDPLLPAILLVSPVSWLQSLPLLSNRLLRSELIIAGGCSLIIAVGWFSGVRWVAYAGVLASFVLTVLLAVVYRRLYSQGK